MQENKIFQNNIQVKRPVFKTTNITSIKPKLIISEKVKSEIKYLNTKSPDKEWSGVLFYTLEGSLNNPKTIIMYAQGILPKDIGTAASTKYEYGEDVTQYLMMKAEEFGIEFEEIVTKWKIAHHHSHCNGGVTPSIVDKEEIEDNIKNHVAYLTTITNNNLNISCFLSVYTKSETKVNFEDFNGDILTKTTDEDSIIKFECEVEWENNIIIDDWFKERVKELEDKSKIIILNNIQSSFSHKNNEYDYTGRRITNHTEKEIEYKKLKDEYNDKSDVLEPNNELDFDNLVEYSLIEVMLPLTSPSDIQNINRIKQAIEEFIKYYDESIVKEDFFQNYFKTVNDLFEENVKLWCGELTTEGYIELIEEYIELLYKEVSKKWPIQLFKNNFENLLGEYTKKLNTELMNS